MENTRNCSVLSTDHFVVSNSCKSFSRGCPMLLEPLRRPNGQQITERKVDFDLKNR